MKDQTNVSLEEIGQISVNVQDFDRAVAFYKETLGIKHLFSVPGRMAFFDCRGIRLMLAIPERPDLDYPSSILYFKVADIKQAHGTGPGGTRRDDRRTGGVARARSKQSNWGDRNERQGRAALNRSG